MGQQADAKTEILAGLVERVTSSGRYRLGIRLVHLANAVLARLDGLAKGIGKGNPWEALQRVALALCGAPVPPPDPKML